MLALTVTLLSACAATYHAAGEGSSGYRELKIAKGVYYVEYTESSNRGWDTIERFALKRCAEIAKENGYKFFDVLSTDQKVVLLESDVTQIIVPGPEGMLSGAGGAPPTNTYTLEGKKVEGHRITYKIQLANE